MTAPQYQLPLKLRIL